MQAQVEELTGPAGLQILRAILENEVTHRVDLRIGASRQFVVSDMKGFLSA